MKRAVTLFLVLTLFAFTLASCNTIEFEYADGGLVKKGTNELYNALPIGFEPCGIGDGYGKFGEFTLYRVVGLNGEEISDDWITEEYSGSATTVFYKGEVPTAESIDFDVFYICEEDTNVVSVAAIDDKEVISEMFSSFETCNQALWPRTDISETYTVKFYSEDLPAVFYSMVYCVCESGNYLYDRANNICVNIGSLISTYVTSE